MTDKELLKLAAKAAGVEVVTPTMLEYGKWNPLTDDGDALRLAVKFGFGIEFDNDGDGVEVFGDSGIEALSANGDLAAATRRAIVRAAAYIGESMP